MQDGFSLQMMFQSKVSVSSVENEKFLKSSVSVKKSPIAVKNALSKTKDIITKIAQELVKKILNP